MTKSNQYQTPNICWLIASIVSLFTSSVSAQISPDGTTPTTVTTEGDRVTIEAGDRQGNNLFHSFQDFSVGNGDEAFFNNAPDIDHILSRVTGGNVSQIDGLIRANGAANLFLINPAGIVFGQGASLSLGGSFYGSTADSILFEDGEFSAVNNLDSPLLTINAPIGLGFRDNPAPIQVQGADLQVNPNQNLALLGGDLNIIDGARIFAPGGHVSLGGLTETGVIELDNHNFSFPEGLIRGNITLNNNILVNVANADGGEITLTGNNIEIIGTTDSRSQLRAGINANTGSSAAQSGEIILDGASSIQLDQAILVNSVFTGATGNAGNITLRSPQITATTSNIQSQLQENAIGRAGNINIETGTLAFGELSRLLSDTNGQGDSGDVTINATDSVSITENSLIQTTVSETGEGQAGDIQISTGRFSLRGIPLNNTFSQLLTGTQNVGDAGNITIEAAESITLDRGRLAVAAGRREVNPEGDSGELNLQAPEISLTNFSFLSASAPLNSTGDAGNITINADNIAIAEGTFITTLTENQANGGDIILTANNLNLVRGGAIVSTTSGSGNAGSIRLNVQDNLHLDGSNPVPRPDSIEPFEEPILNDLILSTGLFVNAVDTATGNAGSITISNPVAVEVINDSIISVASEGTGNGGNLNLTSKDLTLNNRGAIAAFTSNGTGGNINLQVADLILLRDDNNSISARASNQANGGNLKINTTFIVAFPNQNNDLTANASSGDGGNIEIMAESLLGIAERSSQPVNFTNDIDASSEFGLDGRVNIATPDVNPTQGATELDSRVIEPQANVSQICSADNAQTGSKLSIRGKGGIPHQPTEPLSSDKITINNNQAASEPTPEQSGGILTAQGYIYPARSVSVKPNGDIILHSYANPHQSSRDLVKSRNCI